MIPPPQNAGLKAFLPIQTRRLLIRPFRAEDQLALYELHRDPLVTRYAGGTKTLSESRAALQRVIERMAATGLGALAVEELSSGKVIGWCGIQVIADLDEYEVIYALRPEKWGHGLAFEAASTLTSLAFQRLSINKMNGLVFERNVRSIRVLEKLGMRFVRHYYDATSGQQACLYAVAQDDFPVNHSSSSK